MLDYTNLPRRIKNPNAPVSGQKTQFKRYDETDDDEFTYLRRIAVPRATRAEMEAIKAQLGLSNLSETIQYLVSCYVYDEERLKMIMGSVTHKLLRELNSNLTKRRV